MLYAPVASAGYGVLGQAVTDNILLSVSGLAVTVVRSLIFTHLLFAFVVLFNPVAQGLEEVLKVPRGEWCGGGGCRGEGAGGGWGRSVSGGGGR